MRFAITMAMLSMLAVSALIYMSYLGEMMLGIIIAALLVAWPSGFWVLNRIMNRKKSSELKPTEQDIVEEGQAQTQDVPKIAATDADYARINRQIDRLKKASKVLDEEKEQGILSEEAYAELKEQNRKSIDSLEREIGKASGVFDKKVYCRKGKHYIDARDCIPSKVEGYLICQEHNEEIRIN